MDTPGQLCCGIGFAVFSQSDFGGVSGVRINSRQVGLASWRSVAVSLSSNSARALTIDTIQSDLGSVAGE